MPSQFGWRRHYNMDDEDDDDGDKVVPLHCEEAFRNGLTFKAKFIGSMVVPRPTRRMEIVVAMRQVRYNTKAKQTAKVKCLTTISVKGVRSIRRPAKKKKNMKQEECVGGHEIVMMNDPIYRIFYVSHDSHDLNVWSYIARDAASNTFRCNVFKCTRKSKAMKVVRTIGQAFEVCHKITQHQQHVLTGMDVYERIRSKKDHELTPLEQHAIKIAEIHGWRIKPANLASPASTTTNQVVMETDIDAAPTSPIAMETDLDAVTTSTTSPGSQRRREKPRISTDLDRVTRSVTSLAGSKTTTTSSSGRKVKRKSPHASAAKTTTTSNNNNNKMNNSNNNSSNKSFSTQQHIKLLQQQAQLADQQAQIAANQVKQLRIQLKLEMNARSETQARNHRLLVQNRELIQQLSELVTFVKMAEAQQQAQETTSTGASGDHSNNSDLPGMISLSNLQQMITESEARPCTTVIANDRLEHNNSTTSTDIDRIKQERRNGMSGHSYFTSSSDDSSLQTLTNRLSESHPGSCSSDSSTSSDEDENFINEMKHHQQHHGSDNTQCNGNITFENEEDFEGMGKSEEKLDSFSDTSISVLTEEDSLNQQKNPSIPIDETSIWTSGNSSSHFQASQMQTTTTNNEEEKKTSSRNADNSFTLSPILKASTFTDVTPLNFEESFVSRLNTDLDHGSFSDLRKLDNFSPAVSHTTVDSITSNQESKNEASESSIMEHILTSSSHQVVEKPQLSSGSTSSSYFNSLETNFDDNSNYKQQSLQETNNNNNNNTNPFRTTTNNIFSEPATFESELRYEPLRKVQAAERWRGSDRFTSLTSSTINTADTSEEPSLNSFLDTVDTSTVSVTTSTNIYRHQHTK